MYYQRTKIILQKYFFSSAHAIPCSFQSFYLKQELYSPFTGKAVLATFVDLYKIKSSGVPI